MKTFLLNKDKKPTILWGNLKDEIYFEGDLPKDHLLAVNPSKPYVIIDVDKHENKENGFNNIPQNLIGELESTFNYKTKNNGKHYWVKYTGNKYLLNKSTSLGIDLRTHSGYVVYYPKNDIREKLHLVNDSSKVLNKWLEELFTTKRK